MMTQDRTSATINLLGNNMSKSKRGSIDQQSIFSGDASLPNINGRMGAL